MGIKVRGVKIKNSSGGRTKTGPPIVNLEINALDNKAEKLLGELVKRVDLLKEQIKEMDKRISELESPRRGKRV